MVMELVDDGGGTKMAAKARKAAEEPSPTHRMVSDHYIPCADRDQIKRVATPVEIVLFQLEPVARPL